MLGQDDGFVIVESDLDDKRKSGSGKDGGEKDSTEEEESTEVLQAVLLLLQAILLHGEEEEEESVDPDFLGDLLFLDFLGEECSLRGFRGLLLCSSSSQR